MTDVSILVPVLRRPANAAPLVDSIVRTTEGHDYEVVFISTVGDTDQADAVDAQTLRSDVRVHHLTMTPHSSGDYAKKINYAWREFPSTWAFLGADDLRFHPNWLDHALRTARMSGCRVIGTQDLGNRRVQRGLHSTHSLVHRSYVEECGTIDQRGVVLHEGYPHEFVDDEFIETAKRRDEFAFATNSVVEHLHPLWGKASTDAIYADHPRRMNVGRRIYNQRRRLWASR